jgi:Uncharacterized protein containing caspase domain
MKNNMRKALPALAALIAVSTASLSLASCAMSASSITSSRYALVYGIKDYPGDNNDLSYTVNDADSMKTALASSGWTVSESTDSAATYAKIVSDVESLSAISSDSTVLIYYSGHGTTSSGTTYIIPYDGISVSYSTTTNAWTGQTETVESDSLNSSSLISPSGLSTLLAKLPTKNVIVVFDSCYSGAFVDSGSATDSAPSDYSSQESFSAFSTALQNFASLLVSNASASGSKTPIVISAAGADEYSWDGTSSMAHGVFTYYFLQAATSGDSNGDGYITTTEAYTYAYNKIKTTWDASLSRFSSYEPFLPHISGGTRDLSLFTK